MHGRLYIQLNARGLCLVRVRGHVRNVHGDSCYLYQFCAYAYPLLIRHVRAYFRVSLRRPKPICTIISVGTYWLLHDLTCKLQGLATFGLLCLAPVGNNGRATSRNDLQAKVQTLHRHV